MTTNHILRMIRHATSEPEFQPIPYVTSLWPDITLTNSQKRLIEETFLDGRESKVCHFDYEALERRLQDFYELELALDRWLGIETKTFIMDSLGT